MKNPILLFFIFLTVLSTAQKSELDQQYEYTYTISSKAFNDQRKITVYLPPSFYRQPNDKFTVTYILDGQFDPLIDLAAKTIEYNTYMYKYTPTIVVGIHAKNRGWEFSAPILGNKEDEEYEGGRAPELQKHLKNEVFPLIDSIYHEKILPFRNIVGHSSGGAFVLYNLFSSEKDLFDGYIAISPAIRSDSEYILDNASNRLSKGEKFHKFLYCSSGTVGEREELFGGAINRLDSIFQKYPNHGLKWCTSKFEGLGHWTCVSPSINTGMVELTRAFRVDEKLFHDFAFNEKMSVTEQINLFYKDLKHNYGFEEIPTAGYLSRIAWEIKVKNKKKEALEIYTWGMTQHPEHFSLSKARSNLLMEMGMVNEAKKAYKETLVNLEKIQEEISKERYEKQLKYVKEKLNELQKM